MTWTTEQPTKEGWYWWEESAMHNGKHAVLIVEVTDFRGVLYQEHGDVRYLLANASGRWAGPLQPPAEGETHE